ncbi:MAG: Crp/Fnr family transcriptional regulator [Nitrosomonas sp.]|nr:Crp/Fnr family transcriptional regulator [Nitrosomonas sp.]
MDNKNKKRLVSLTDEPVTPPSPDISTVPVPSKNKVNLTINLRHIPLLSQLNNDEMDQVKKNLTIRQYARRDALLQKGAGSDSLLFLLSGNIQVVDLTDQGSVIGLSLLSPGDFFGEVALINHTAHTASVVALSEVLVASLQGTTALHLFTHAPSVAQKIQQHLAQKVQRDYKFRSLLSINNTSKRIFSFLVLMKQKNAEKQELVVNLPTHQEIANMMNTSRETVTRALLMLAQQGIVRKDAHRLIITNPDALKKLVQNA